MTENVKMLRNDEIQKVVADVLTAVLPVQSLLGTNIEYENDFDGEAIVRVTARLREPLDQSELLFEAANDIRSRLLQHGDDRFVFVRQSDPTSDNEQDEDLAESDLR